MQVVFAQTHNGWSFAIGKHEGELLLDVIQDDFEYIEWMRDASDISEEAMDIVEEVMEQAQNEGMIQ